MKRLFAIATLLIVGIVLHPYVHANRFQQTAVLSDTTDTLNKHSLISAADSLRLHLEAEQEAMTNPLFLDWIFMDNKELSKDSVSHLKQVRNNARRYVVGETPDAFVYHYGQLPSLENLMIRRSKTNPSIFVSDTNILSRPLKEKEQFQQLKDPTLSNWSRSLLVQIQGTQNYISPNWYNGGESSLALLGYLNGQLKYDDRKNLQWESQLEWKAGLNGVMSDTLHKLRVGEDLLKITSKLGVKAVKNFYYTASVEASATLFNTYLSNSYERATAPISPIRFYGNLGMDYKYKKILSVLLSPLSYKMVYVYDTTVHPGVSTSVADKVGIPDGKKILHQFGSSLEVKFNYSISREIVIDSKMKLYTNYKGVEWDWEILGNFIINRFLSARVSLNPRFDSTVKTEDGSRPKLQFKELLSLGFSYKL